MYILSLFLILVILLCLLLLNKYSNKYFNKYSRNTYVVTRSYMENCYLECFIKHYISLGFTKIIIFKTDDIPYNDCQDLKNRFDIYNVKNEGNDIYNNNINIIKKYNGWYLFVDIDEFLVLPIHKTINNFLSDILKRNNNTNTVLFRWAMIEKYNINKNDCNFKDIFDNYQKYSNTHIKTFINSKNFISIKNPHFCKIKKPCIYFENNIIYNNAVNHNLSNNSYKESYIIHIHTRSLINIITKSLNNYNNMCSYKKINNKDNFIKYINSKKYNYSSNLLKDFRDLIGVKSNLPFDHSKGNKLKLDNTGIKHNYPLINFYKEDDMLKIYCNNYKINIDIMKEYLNKLNNKCNKLFKI